MPRTKDILDLLTARLPTLSGGAGPVSDASTHTKLDTLHADVDGVETALGATNETAPANDTAASGLNGRLQRIAQRITTLIASVAALATTIVLAAGENLVGLVGGVGDLVDVTLSLDTSAYADGDVLADTQVVTNALRKTDGTGVLTSLLVLDEDDQGVGLDLLFFNANVSLGTENSTPSITDANMRNYLGKVSVTAGDFNDWGGVRTATVKNIGLFLKSVSGSRDIYVAAVTRSGTPTYTASGIRLRLGVLWN